MTRRTSRKRTSIRRNSRRRTSRSLRRNPDVRPYVVIQIMVKGRKFTLSRAEGEKLQAELNHALHPSRHGGRGQ